MNSLDSINNKVISSEKHTVRPTAANIKCEHAPCMGKGVDIVHTELFSVGRIEVENKKLN
jgi:hypothetical protein